MNVLSRILRLEKARPKVYIDNNDDGFYTALLGDDINEYKEKHYGPNGWDLVAVLNEVAGKVWDDG